MEKGHSTTQLILFLALFACSLYSSAKAATNPLDVQAVLIKNFTHLIEWPAERHLNSNTSFTICIYGSQPLAQQFKNIFTGKTVKGKKARIVIISSFSLDDCDLVYIPPSSDEAITSLLKSASKLGVLTVSSNNGYGEKGVHINFFESSKHIAFELNKHTLDRAGFKVSTQLYRYARIVQ